MTVKRAHMVSKGYIRAWADETKILEVIDLQDRRGYRSSFEKATVVSYGYDPKVLSRDLERDYSRIENSGIPAIVRLRNGNALSATEQGAVIAFLDMHLDRGRYADQTKARIPAMVLKTGGQIEDAELALGDMLLLSRSFKEVLRLNTLGLEKWQWQVRDVKHLATGDGAVLLWQPTAGADVSTISFPLSPTQLLIIGQDLAYDIDLNQQLADNSKRWLVGRRGMLRLDHPSFTPAQGSLW